jgi:hypothetical protein
VICSPPDLVFRVAIVLDPVPQDFVVLHASALVAVRLPLFWLLLLVLAMAVGRVTAKAADATKSSRKRSASPSRLDLAAQRSAVHTYPGRQPTRSASRGLVPAARAAGSKLASSATAKKIAVVAAIVSGWTGVTP